MAAACCTDCCAPRLLHTHTYTLCRDHFTQHAYFGLDPQQVVLFQQGFLPCLTAEGGVILETACRVGGKRGERVGRGLGGESRGGGST